MKGTLPRRVPLEDAFNVPDRSREIARRSEQQTHLLEGTLLLLRNDQLITPTEFSIVCSLVGLFEYPQQSSDVVARKLRISVAEVERSLQDVLGKIKGHSNSVLRRLREVESMIKNIDEIAG